MNRAIQFIVAGTGFVVVAGLVFELRRPAPASNRSSVAVPVEARTTGDGEIDGLKRAIAALEAKLMGLQWSATVASLASTAPEAPSRQGGPSSPAEEAEAEAFDVRQIALLERKMQDEQPDGAWAPVASASLRDMAQKVSARGARLDETQCFSSFCRLSISAAQPSALEEGLRSVIFAMPWAAETYSVSDGEKVAIYVAREGTRLPHAE